LYKLRLSLKEDDWLLQTTTDARRVINCRRSSVGLRLTTPATGDVTRGEIFEVWDKVPEGSALFGDDRILCCRNVW